VGQPSLEGLYNNREDEKFEVRQHAGCWRKRGGSLPARAHGPGDARRIPVVESALTLLRRGPVLAAQVQAGRPAGYTRLLRNVSRARRLANNAM
jgi:hypothetical protein